MWALNKPEAGYLVLGFIGALVSRAAVTECSPTKLKKAIAQNVL